MMDSSGYFSGSTSQNKEKLFKACKNDNFDVVKQLVEEEHVDLQLYLADNAHNDTLLHYAAYCGCLEIVKYLVESAKCVAKSENKYKNTPLHRAARQGHLEVVKYLIETQNCDPMCKCHWGRVPLHSACKHGRIHVVRYLIENAKVDTSVKDTKYNSTPFDLAAEYGTLEVVEYMHQHVQIKNIEPGIYTPLHLAAFGGKLDIVKFLFDPMSKSSNGLFPLHSACKSGQLEVIKYLIEECAVDMARCDDKTPLDIAAEHGQLNVVKYFVENKQCIVEHKIKNQDTALHYAACCGKLKIIKYFIDGGYCRPSCRGWIGRTPLHLACSGGKMEIVDYLIDECNVDASVQDDVGMTPLHLAAKDGHLPLVKQLITKFSCSPHIKDNSGKTPSDYASGVVIADYLSHVENVISSELREALKYQLDVHTLNCKPTGNELGHGAFGTVIELKVNTDGKEKLVAGKVFQLQQSGLTNEYCKKLIKEIKTLSRLQHSNIVLYKGVCFLQDSFLPVLVMERLVSNFHTYLLHPEKHPFEERLSILLNVANGLDYLHSHTPAIVHRDLTAKNVLLDSELRAKITDFGNAMILETDNVKPELNNMDSKIDILQFGNLTLFAVLQKEIRPIKPPTYYCDSTKTKCYRSEKERREQFMEMAKIELSEDPTLFEMIEQCLNAPNERPDATKLKKYLTHRKHEKSLLIRGADTVAETEIDITPGVPCDFTWKGYGFKLYIPADALKQEDDALPGPIKMKIKASINGQFLLPDNLQLISGIYWVKFKRKFSKPITLSIQHCYNLRKSEQVSSLCFVTAKCNQEHLPYNFQKMSENGTFSTESSYGTIELQHFSGIGIALPKEEASARQNWNNRYIAQAYYLVNNTKSCAYQRDVHVPIIWDLELYRKIVREKYSVSRDKNEERQTVRKDISAIEEGPRMIIDINSDKLSLKACEPQSGWKIVPLTTPTLLHDTIDSYNAGTEIPAFQYDVSWEGNGSPTDLCQTFCFEGTRLENSYMTVILRPPMPSTASPTSPICLSYSSLNSTTSTTSVPASPVSSQSSQIPDSNDATPVLPQEKKPEEEKFLDCDDFFDVLTELIDVAARWEGIWVALRLSPNDLETVKVSCNGDPEQGLRATIRTWLNKNYNYEKYGNPSWKMLALAVGHKCGGQNKALEEIISDHVS